MNKFFLILYLTIFSFCLSSCRDDIGPETKKPSRTLLIYAVASNNLESYLEKDMEEMIEAAPSVDGLGSNINVLLYSVTKSSTSVATLYSLAKTSSGEWTFQPLRTYDRDTFSTDPQRMNEIYSAARELAPADTYGLILWSHGTGWIPEFYSHGGTRTGMQRSFGWDSYQGVTDKCDLIELADAIPAGMFDYIWFDACYMMGIEVAYQLRDKCDYIGGYPSEDWSPGMNYDSTLPMLAAYKPDLEGAAKSFYDYYSDSNMAVTVTLVATDGLDRLADAAADVYAAGSRPSSSSGLVDYGRYPCRGLYDFGQFSEAYFCDSPSSDESDLLTRFKSALSDVVVFGGCSSKDFNGKDGVFSPQRYSGFSCHFPGTSDNASEEYYLNLDWTKATNP